MGREEEKGRRESEGAALLNLTASHMAGAKRSLSEEHVPPQKIAPGAMTPLEHPTLHH